MMITQQNIAMSQKDNSKTTGSIKVDLYSAIEEVFPDFNHNEKIYSLINELQQAAFNEGIRSANGTEDQSEVELSPDSIVIL